MENPVGKMLKIYSRKDNKRSSSPIKTVITLYLDLFNYRALS